MDKYTDEQVKKARAHFKYGIDCDIFSEPVLTYAKIALDALDLINRYEAEKSELQYEIARYKAKIEALKMENEQLQTDNFNANMNSKHVQANNESLQNIIVGQEATIVRQEAEIEKLERTISHLEDYCNALPDQIRAELAEETKCEPIDRCINIVEERARLQRYVKIIIAAINYKGTADHEDVLSILREFETENLDLLNRDECDKQLLEAEIERLTKYNDKLIEEVDNLIYACDYAKQEAIKEFAKKIDELLKRYSHLHELVEKVRHSTEEYADGTPIEMVSVWEVLSLKKNEMVDYETMNDLQDNIEVIAKERLLTEFEKDFRLLVKEMEGESK